MKNQRLRFKLLFLLMFGMFVVLAVFGGFSVDKYGTRWFASRWNTRIDNQKENVTPGSLLDRTGVPLAQTNEQGERVYATEESIRRSVVHVVGDSRGMVANGAESFQSRWLYGFNTSLPELVQTAFTGGSRRGDDVVLTISGELSAEIASVWNGRNASRGHNGAVVVLNWKTGEVIAMVSLPGFDPMSADAPELSAQPYWNRAVQGVYQPGSTFKVITAASALDNLPGITDERFSCTGTLTVDGTVIGEAGGAVHGQTTLENALAVSCNTTFAHLALRLSDNKNEKLRRTAESFGFNDNFLFRDLVVENSTYPSAVSGFALAQTGFGQGAIGATPMHMAMVAASIANNGVMMEPRTVLEVRSPAGKLRRGYEASVYRKVLSPETADVLRGWMRGAVQRGTGIRAAVSGMSICGKTGTATSDHGTSNAWFIGFNDDESLPFALCVLVEDVSSGEGGGSVAAPIAADIFTWLRAHAQQVTGTVVVSTGSHPDLEEAAQNILAFAQNLLNTPTPVPDVPAVSTEVPTATPTPRATASPTPGPTTMMDIVNQTVVDLAGEQAGGVINSVIDTAVDAITGK